MNNILQEQIYFKKLEEYLNFIKEYYPKVINFHKEKYYWNLNINEIMWKIFPHWVWIKMQKVLDNYEIDFDLLYEKGKDRYYYDKWKFENQIKHNFIDSCIFSDNFSKREEEYNRCSEYFINKNWISEKKWLLGGFYISKIHK